MTTFFVIILAGIIAFYFNNKFNSFDDRLKQLELNSLPTKIANPQTIPNSKNQIHIPQPALVNNDISKPNILESKNSFDFIAWFKEDWALKVGGVLILLGFVWLVSYAFLNNWIGPVARITLGLVAGSVLMLWGNKRISFFKNQGLTLISVGASITLVSVYSAQAFYDMFPPVIALLLSAMVAVFCGVSSVRNDDKPLIIVAFIAGALAPILTASPTSSLVSLFGYLLSLNLGLLWVTYYKNWRFLIPLSIALTTIYALPYFFLSNFKYLKPSEIIELKFFAVTFTTLYFSSEVMLIIKTKLSKHSDIITGLMIGMFSLGWIGGLIPEYLRGETSLFVALLFMIASFYLFKMTRIKSIVYTYTGTAILLLIAATSFEFSGPTLTIALIIQALIIPIVISRLLNKEVGTSMLLYFLLPMILSLESLTSFSWSNGIMHQDFVVLLLLTLSLFIVGVNQLKLFSSSEEGNKIGKIILIISGIYGLMLIWLVCNSLILQSNIARTVILITYTLIGLITYLRGQYQQNLYLNRFGLGVIIFVIARLLLVEVWDMQLSTRIITFFGIGLLLMGSVFIPKNIKHENSN